MIFRLSLRAYFFTISLFLVTCLSIGYSVLTGVYFGQGLDLATSSMLRKLAESEQLPEQLPDEVLGFYITHAWQEQPKEVISKFSQPPEHYFELEKVMDERPLFSPPGGVYIVAKLRTPLGKELFASRYLPAPGSRPEPGSRPPMPPAEGVMPPPPEGATIPFDEESKGLQKPPFKADFDAEPGQWQRPPPPKPVGYQPASPKEYFLYLLLFFLCGIGLFALLLFLFMRMVAGPVGQLKEWAASLTVEKLKQPQPDFTFKDLNELATIVQKSLRKSHEALEREQEFLNYASHELRTPIAVFRSNCELLMKMVERGHLDEDLLVPVVERIQRSSTTMSSLTETLLWLGRDEETLTSEELVPLDKLITELVVDLKYLLKGKSVDLNLNLDCYEANLPATPCRIALGNFIRNAFQHTLWGSIEITLSQGVVTIKNTNSAKGVEEQRGFGLGLKLVDKLVARYGWGYSVTTSEDNNYHLASITFMTEPQS